MGEYCICLSRINIRYQALKLRDACFKDKRRTSRIEGSF
jgi:hypothetical protein